MQWFKRQAYFHSHSIGKGNRVGYHNPDVDLLLDEAEIWLQKEEE